MQYGDEARRTKTINHGGASFSALPRRTLTLTLLLVQSSGDARMARAQHARRGDRGEDEVKACEIAKGENGPGKGGVRVPRFGATHRPRVGIGQSVRAGSMVHTWRAHLSPSSPTMASRPSKDVRTASIPITSSMSSIAGCGPSSSSVHVKTTACPIGQPCWFPL